MPIGKDRQIKFWLAVGAVAFGALYVLKGVLTPFVLGMCIAYALDPLCDRLERRGLSRSMATVVVIGSFFLLATGALAVLVPVAWGQAADLLVQAPDIKGEALAYARSLAEAVDPYVTDEVMARLKEATGTVASTAANWSVSAVKAILSGGLALVDILSVILITPLVAFYLVRDWDRITAAIDGLFPRNAAEAIRERFRDIDRTIAAWMRGQASVCLILAAFYAVCLTAIGLDFALLIGLTAGVLSFIPFFGFFSGLVLSMGSALFTFDHWSWWLATAAIFVVGQFMEGNILQPKLVGNSVGLHEVWVIFALMAGGSLFGATGVLLSVPVAAIAGVLVRYAVGAYKASELYAVEDGENSQREDGEK